MYIKSIILCIKIFIFGTVLTTLTGCIGPRFNIEKINNTNVYTLNYDNIATEERTLQIGKVPLEITHKEGSPYTFYKLTSEKIKDWKSFYMRSKETTISPKECSIERNQLICKFDKDHMKLIDTSLSLDLVLTTESGRQIDIINSTPTVAQISYCRMAARKSSDPVNTYRECINYNRKSKVIVIAGTGIDMKLSPSSSFHRELRQFKSALYKTSK
ncbi:hypothetical protein [Halarcobacter anaerophilus]|uniref:hypothetical protein n=1 Tax=Halarcobacter anaerophilus TaxID=877500 RepID=UPI0005CAE1E2|nr:hypothetical protein [Halarcobacter anaerophilus]